MRLRGGAPATPFSPRAPSRHALRPECGRAIGVSNASAGRPRHSSRGAHSLGPHLLSSPLTTSRVRRAAGGAKGPPRTERLLTHHGAARLCFNSPHPAPVAEDCSPTSLPVFLASLAPPHTRRFLGESLDARLLRRCAPASLQMRANAVFAPFLLAWLLILNMVPGARGLALASMVPRVSKTYRHSVLPSATTGPSSIHRSTHLDHPPRPPSSTTPFLKRVPLLPRVPCLMCRACFFSCTGLRLSSSLHRPSAPKWVGSVTRGGAFAADACAAGRGSQEALL